MVEKQIQNDILVAMKNSDKSKVSTLRMLKSAIQIEKTKSKNDLSEDDILMIIKKQLKQRNESILEYTKYNRFDMVESLKQEIEILEAYLPKQLSQEELIHAVEEIVHDFPDASIKDMGKIMKIASSKLGKVADMSIVSKLIKEKIS